MHVCPVASYHCSTVKAQISSVSDVLLKVVYLLVLSLLQDGITAVMKWRQFPSQALMSLDNQKNLSSLWKPCHVGTHASHLLPSSSTTTSHQLLCGVQPGDCVDPQWVPTLFTPISSLVPRFLSVFPLSMFLPMALGWGYPISISHSHFLSFLSRNNNTVPTQEMLQAEFVIPVKDDQLLHQRCMLCVHEYYY